MKITDEMREAASVALGFAHPNQYLSDDALTCILKAGLAASRYERELRDKFAGQALTGIIAKSPFKTGTLKDMRASGDTEARAAAAYDYADAMLAERRRPS